MGEVATKKSTKRTKKFTGCWTCRRRGVKCDESKPLCFNCGSTGLACEGYGIRLCWENNQKSNSKNPRFDSTRSYILHQWDEEDLLNDLQVNYYLEKIDSSSEFILVDGIQENLDDVFSYGPFRVFGFHSNKNSIDVNRLEESSKKIVQDPTVVKNFEFFSKQLEEISFTGLTTTTDAECIILDYWTNKLSTLLVPIMDEDFNPYKMITEAALNDHSISLDIRKTVIHSICAICASYLCLPNKSSELATEYQDVNFEEYWKFHKSNSFEMISITYLFKEVFSCKELGMLAASILFLLTIDVFHPSNQWQIHLKGVLSILRPVLKKLEESDGMNCKDDQTEVSKVMMFFADMSKISYIFCSSSDWSAAPDCSYELAIQDFDFISFPNETPDSSLLYKNHGITDGMLSCLTDTVKLLQCKNAPETHNKDLSDMLIRLQDNQPNYLPFDETSTPLNTKIRYHQSVIFYIAVKLYFLREVLSENPANIQYLVNTGIDHIEKCQELMLGLGTIGLFWPCFVICCETVTPHGQERLERTFQNLKEYDITNIDQGIEIIREVWKERLIDEQISWLTIKGVMNATLLLS